MKKYRSSFLILGLFILFPALAAAETFYWIYLKNGGRLSTPHHWSQGSQKYFFYLGGTVGIEESLIDRIEKYDQEIDYSFDRSSENRGKKEPPPPSPSVTGASPATEKTTGPRAGEEPINIKASKAKKDQMTVDLDSLMEKRRVAISKGDNEAKEKITEEIRKLSTQIYDFTDEVTQRNQGKLPEGWWNR